MTTASSPDAAAPASSPASWAAVASVGVGAFALVTSEFLPVGLLPQIAEDLGVTDGQAGLMITIPGILAAIAAPLTIGLAGRLNRRHVLVALLGLLVVSNLIVAAAPGFTAILIGRILLGIAVGGFWTIGGSLGPRLKSGAAGARATALIYSGVSLGTVAGVPAGALLGNALGWRLAFGVSAGMAALVVLALILLLPSIRATAGSGLRQIPDVLRLRKIKVGLGASVFIFIGQFAAYTYIAPFLGEVSAVTPTALSAVLLAYGAAGFVGNLFGGWAVGRDVRATLIATTAVLGGSVLLAALLGANAALAIALVVAWGFAWGMVPIAMQTWMFSAAPDRLESVAALFVSVAQAAIGAGALVGGLTVDHFGVVGALWLGGSSAVATALLVAMFGGQPKSAEVTPNLDAACPDPSPGS